MNARALTAHDSSMPSNSATSAGSKGSPSVVAGLGQFEVGGMEARVVEEGAYLRCQVEGLSGY